MSDTGAFGEPNAAPDGARFVLLPVPYEKTTTYNKGTANGPAALLAASTQVELFDEEMRREPLKEGVHLAEPVTVDGMPDALADALEPAVAAHLEAKRVVACLGGEHSISLGPIRATAKKFPGVGVLQIDAHPDLRDEYEGTRFGHGCVMRRVFDLAEVGRLVQVGLRAVSDEDDSVRVAEPTRVRWFPAHKPLEIDTVINALPARVYISVDLDGLDPSVVPGTGTPEPGGLQWWETLRLLRAVFEQRSVVGFDIVELLPQPPSIVSDFAAAKLLFKMLAYAVGP